MSMISAQCDELRKRAKTLGNLSPWFDGPKDAKLMERAADTIKSLSDNLSDMVDCRERARALEGESQALRDLCANLWPVAKSGVCIERCKLYDECIPNYDENGCILKRQLRELGIVRDDVDGF